MTIQSALLFLFRNMKTLPWETNLFINESNHPSYSKNVTPPPFLGQLKFICKDSFVMKNHFASKELQLKRHVIFKRAHYFDD